MCYSIYLTHCPIVMGLGRVLRPVARLSLVVSLPLVLAIVVPLVLVIGMAFFALIERPRMDPAWPAIALASLRRGDPAASRRGGRRRGRVADVDAAPTSIGYI